MSRYLTRILNEAPGEKAEKPRPEIVPPVENEEAALDSQTNKNRIAKAESLAIQSEKVGYPNAESLDSKIALNNKELIIMWKTKPSIIDCYLKLTKKKKWKAHDDRAAYPFNEVDIRLIELGIIQTIINAGSITKIHSFKYCITEIEAFVERNYDEKTIQVIWEINKPKVL